MFVDGTRMMLQSYEINGSRYVRIRDIAYALSGTPKQFNVQWSSAEGAILLTSGGQYRAVGGEMALNGKQEGIARLSMIKTLLDGEEVLVCVYNFRGENLYRLRDIGRVIDFHVGWDSSRQAIIIDTSRRSSEPDISPESFRPWVRDIDPTRPMVALTFDDGPSFHTIDVLDTLERHNSVATFFVTGRWISSHSQTVLRAHNMGNEIVGHAWSHPTLTAVTDARIHSEIDSTNRAIEELTGTPSMLFRPPYGAHNNRVRAISQDLGVPIILWSLDTHDWDGRGSNVIYNTVMNNVRDGDIILFHDTRGTTSAAVRRIVPDLIARGYQLVTVTELLYYSGITPKPGGVYFHAR